jgi:hypothetical protein
MSVISGDDGFVHGRNGDAGDNGLMRARTAPRLDGTPVQGAIFGDCSGVGATDLLG